MAEQAASDMEPWQSLEGKVVMITGASSGIGRDFCLDLAKAGCRIVAAARRTDRLQSLCDQINQLHSSSSSYLSSSSGTNPYHNSEVSSESTVQAVATELDVSGAGLAIEAAVNQAWDAFGRIDALINNAGFRGNVKSPLNLTEEEWNSTFNTNARGTWMVSKYVSIRMRDAKLGGTIINISSIADVNRGHLPGGPAYAASKAAINTLTKVMALELGAFKIRINSIAPGLFRSEITAGLMQKDWLHNVAQRIIPLRSHGTVDPALTSLIRYLIHDSSKYVTGNLFIVDAGATLSAVPIFSSL